MNRASVWERVLALACLAFLFVMFAEPAQARRVALVIGNGGYENLKVLPNARHDADAVAERLVVLGFEVIRPGGGSVAHRDLGLKDFLEAEARFRESARGAEIAFLYYAGHGMQLGDRGDAYLLPVDAALPRSATDFLLLQRQSVALDEVLEGLDGLADLTVAVFDACREIPELETVTRSIAGVSSYRGLSRPKISGRNRVVAFSAAAGQLAEDGEGRNSPYTAALLKELELRPEREVADLFRAVAYEVGQGRMQQPEVLIQGVPPGTYFFREPRAPGIQVAGGIDWRDLLEECTAHESAHRLTSGAAGNALDCYREVLSLKRGDREALAGIARIEAAYAQGARKALVGGDAPVAAERIERLRQVNAEHPELWGLERDLAALNSESAEPVPEPGPERTRLTVRATPKDAQVRILNIVPAYRADMDLEPGRYELEVSASGYGTYRQWHELSPGNRLVEIVLEARERQEPVASAEQATSRPEANLPVRQRFEPDLVLIEGDCFEMGSSAVESSRRNNERQHRVCVEDFWMGQYEVTQSQWQAVMGSNPSRFKGERRPVENVSWHDVQEFIEKLNERTGRLYRLPTEAEWEYACRSGGKSERYCGGSDVDHLAWHSGNSGGETHPVGGKKANDLGLYDMSGNVWEWTCSGYDRRYGGGEMRCASDSSNSSRVYRGGSWGINPDKARSAFRYRALLGFRVADLGFRLSRTK